MTIQRRSRSDRFFISSYIILGTLLLVGFVGTFGLSKPNLFCFGLQIFALIGLGIVDFLMYVRYDMRTFYKKWEDKTEEEKIVERNKKAKANKIVLLFCGPILVLLFLSYFNIVNSGVVHWIMLNLAVVALSACTVIYYK
jgi:hypothetical protein